jgi:biopolymer transport protein ExbD
MKPRRFAAAFAGARPVNRDHARVNVTPMIDVVMVLIVFFLLVGHLAGERRGAVDLPTARAGDQESPASRPVFLLVEPTGDIRLDGQPVALNALPQTLAPFRDRPVQIRAGKDTPYERVRPALTACREAGIAEVKLVVKPETAG